MKHGNRYTACTEHSLGKFLILWSGDFASAIGSGLTSFDLSVYIFQQTDRVSYIVLVILLVFLPSLLLDAPTGILADRYDRRLLVVLRDSFSTIGLVFILICLMSGQASVWQICIGVTISSVLSSLLEPAYKATITDMLTPEQYSKASGMVQIAGSTRYLISPVLAGFLLTIPDIRLLLLIDICTFFITVSTTLVVRRSIDITSQASAEHHSFLLELRDGWQVLTEKKGLLPLVVMGSLTIFRLGSIQALTSPMILSFSDSASPRTIMTAVATEMLASNLLLGSTSIRTSYANLLSLSLFGAGVAMTLFGLRENLLLIGVFGLLFFAILPFTNASLDYLLRTNIDNQVRGRAWGFIGPISRLGCVAAYVLSGVLVDYLFAPPLLPGRILSASVGRILGTGQGRGIGLLIALAGLLLYTTSVFLFSMKPIRQLESAGDGRRP